MSIVTQASDHVMWAPILAFSCILIMLGILLSTPFLLTRMRRVPAVAWFLDKLSACMGAPWPPVSDTAAPPRRPLSKALRNQLAVSHFKSPPADCETGEVDSCPICFGDYSEGQAIITLRCKHYFHKECIWKWLKRDSKCPMCKTDLHATSAVVQLPPRSNSNGSADAGGAAAAGGGAATRGTAGAESAPAAAAAAARQTALTATADEGAQPTAAGAAEQQALV